MSDMDAVRERTWRTCVRCDRDLYPRLCRRTDEGWEHVACRPLTVAFMRCTRCHMAAEPTESDVCATCAALTECIPTESPAVLDGGAWVQHGLIQRWEAAS